MESFTKSFILVLSLMELTAGQSAESRLLNNLFSGRTQDVRPVRNASDTVVVKIDIFYSQIVKLDSKQQILTSAIWLRLFWETPYLVWDPKKFDGIENLHLKPSAVWIPDITVYNAINEKQDKSLFNALDTSLHVLYNGKVTWLAPAILNTDCTMAIDYFPFDSQSCPIKVASWSHDMRFIDLRFKYENRTIADTDSYRENSEWRLISVQKERNLEQFSCCPAPFTTVTLTVKIRRRPSYYVTNVLLPCGLIALLTLSSFGLPLDSGERVSLVIAILLAMSFYMTIISNTLPPNSSGTPMISVFFMVVMIQIALVLVVTCLIIRCHSNDCPLPAFVASFVNNKLAKLVRLKKRGTKVEPLRSQKQLNKENIRDFEVVKDLQDIRETDDIATEIKQSDEKTSTIEKHSRSLHHPNEKGDFSHEKGEFLKNNAAKWRFAACVLNRVFFVLFVCSSLLSSSSIFLSLYLGSN